MAYFNQIAAGEYPRDVDSVTNVCGCGCDCPKSTGEMFGIYDGGKLTHILLASHKWDA